MEQVSAAVNGLPRAEIAQDSDMMSISQLLNLAEETMEDTPIEIEVRATSNANSDT